MYNNALLILKERYIVNIFFQLKEYIMFDILHTKGNNLFLWKWVSLRKNMKNKEF